MAADHGDQIVEVPDGSSKRIVTSNTMRRKFENMVGLNSTFFRRIVGGNQKLHSRNGRLVMFCVIATSLDPLFCYIMLVDEDRRCIKFDKKLRTIAVIFRSITDFLYVILTVYYFHVRYPLLDDESDRLPVRIRKFVLSSSRVDILAVLPFPQVVTLFVVPRFKEVQFIHAIRALNYILLVQFLSRVIRIYSFLKKFGWSTILPRVAEAKAIFNLILYMLASHVIGAFWYLATIERKATCWRGRCQHCPLNCNYALGNSANNADNFCSAEVESGVKTFDFGIFKDALPIVNSRDFITKISHCYWWGLQKLSSLGQDLKTSGHLLEVYFAITITISGLVLFALLIGNLQTYLQSSISSLEKIIMKERDIEECMTNYSIPWKLKRRIRKCKWYKQQETKGVGVEQLLQNIPTHVSRDIKEHLCSSSILRVLLKLENLDEKLSNAIYHKLKPKRYIEQTFLSQEGGPVNEVVFIIQGKVYVSSKSTDGRLQGESNWLTKGNFYGEELVDWATSRPNFTTLPICTKTIYALSEVQVFVLLANDFKTIVSNFWWIFCRNNPSNLRDKWAPFAASALQSAWHRYNQSRPLKERTDTTHQSRPLKKS